MASDVQIYTSIAEVPNAGDPATIRWVAPFNLPNGEAATVLRADLPGDRIAIKVKSSGHVMVFSQDGWDHFGQLVRDGAYRTS